MYKFFFLNILSTADLTKQFRLQVHKEHLSLYQFAFGRSPLSFCASHLSFRSLLL